MTISTELMYAILSMDAYNLGYGTGISDGDHIEYGVDLGLGDAVGTLIVGAYIVGRSDSDPNGAAQDAGFYAVAYEWNGQTVISYRGTDNLDILSWDDQYGSGIWNAYAQGAGGLLVGLSEQNALAAEFFQAVTGTSDGDPAQGNAILAGHSLGGGLAAERLAA